MGNYNKTSLCILALLILSVSSASSWRSIVLTQNNHVAIRGSINSQSISDVLYKLGTEIVPTLNGTHNEIFIYLNSGGGTVYAGNKLIEEIMFLQNRNVTVSCIASRAYSMAFDIFQVLSWLNGIAWYLPSQSLFFQEKVLYPQKNCERLYPKKPFHFIPFHFLLYPWFFCQEQLFLSTPRFMGILVFKYDFFSIRFLF